MADLSKIRLNNTNYNLKDAVAREGLTAIQNSLETLHDPEDDEDVDDMLESLDLTVIDDDNLVGSAEIGSGNVVDWNPAKQVSGGGAEPFIIHQTDDKTNLKYILDKTWKEIDDAFMSGRMCILDGSYYDDHFERTAVNHATIKNIYTILDIGRTQYSIVFSNDEIFITFDENDYPDYYYGD